MSTDAPHGDVPGGEVPAPPPPEGEPVVEGASPEEVRQGRLEGERASGDTFPEEARQGRLEGEPASEGAFPEEARQGGLEGDQATGDASAPHIPELVEPPEVPPAVGHDTFSEAATIGDATEASAEPETAPDAEPVTEVPETIQQAPAQETYPAPVQTVYVTVPTPPKRRGNRGIGTLLAIVATVVFAALLAVISALYRGVVTGALATTFTVWLPEFLAQPLFYVPVAVFLVLFILFVLVVNRANWGVYVLGSFLLAIALYFASIGLLLVVDRVFFHSSGGASFVDLSVSPAIVIATVVAREVVIWFGAAVSSRGRRIKARNVEAVAEYDREAAEKKAEFERAQYGTVGA